MTSLDSALETVKRVHHYEMRTYKQSVISKLDDIRRSGNTAEELAKYVNFLKAQIRSGYGKSGSN